MARGVRIFVGANISQLEKSFLKASFIVRNFGAQVTSTVSRIGSFGAAVAGIGAGVGIASLVRSSFAAIDSTSKLADRLGITTESLVALHQAAKISGGGIDEVDASLRKFISTIGQTSEASSLGRLLRGLGISAQSLASVGLDEAIAQVADVLQSLPNAADRAALAVQLFGRDGLKMVNILQGGRQALAGFAKETERLGTSFGRVDGAKIEAANDAVTRMRDVFSGLANTIAFELAPFVEAIANRFVNWATEGSRGANFVRSAVEQVAIVIAKAVDITDLFIAGWHGLRSIVASVESLIFKVFEELAQRVVTFIDLLGISHEGLDKFITDAGLLSQAFADTADDAEEDMSRSFSKFANGSAAAATKKFFEDIRKEAEEAVKATKSAGDLVGPPAPARLSGLLDDIEEGEERMKRLETLAERVSDRLKTPFERVGEELIDALDVFEAGFLNANQLIRAFDLAQDELKEKIEQQDLTPVLAQQFRAGFEALPGSSAGAQNKEQRVRDPQLQEAIAVLYSIDRNGKRIPIAVAG